MVDPAQQPVAERIRVGGQRQRRLQQLLRATAGTAAAVGVALAAVGAPSPSTAAPAATAPGGSAWLSGTDAEWRPDIDRGPFASVVRTVGANQLRTATGGRYTGYGVGVALIDTGVVPVDGLDNYDQVVNGPDLSFESQSDELRYLDTYGHGTHMAGIIAGRDDARMAWFGSENGGDANQFVGVAPGARLVNVKVAAGDGATDVSQVIAAIDWVVQHRADFNIRVLNLSYGTASLQPYEIDPLAHAVEQAWHHGIVVVVAAGNDGEAGTRLNDPAIDPYVIAVGASDHRGTSRRDDDTLASFSSVGGDPRRPDLVAPGRSITSLRDPSSHIDARFPEAREGDPAAARFFRGSGSSQAAAVTSGAAAVLLQARPQLTPDQVKYLLMENAEPLVSVGAAQGAGQLQLRGILGLDPSAAPVQAHPRSQGTGSLEAARGGVHVADPTTGHELSGEVDIFGMPWNAPAWAASSAAGNAWTWGDWRGQTWSGGEWCRAGYQTSWCAEPWTSTMWTGLTWRTDLWEGLTWRNGSWTGLTWRDSMWTGLTWRTDVWTGVVWRKK